MSIEASGIAVPTGVPQISVEQLLIECKDVQDAGKIRGELLSWNPRDYWFYVYNNGFITVANSFGGRLPDDLFTMAKEKAKELMFTLSKQ